MSYKIVVMSCDKNKDLFEPFHKCMEKYWHNHPEIIYSTETIVNPYYTTICRNLPITQWTRRVRETVKDLPCKHILLMVDDIFIRDYVDSGMIWNLTNFINNDIASLNFEFSFDPLDVPYKITNFGKELYMRNPGGKFKLSCMCQMWQKQKLLELFNYDIDPWNFEKKNLAKYYTYLISKNGDLLNWGKKREDWHWGIVKGKWTQECKEFFDKEGIEMDYSTRGFID